MYKFKVKCLLSAWFPVEVEAENVEEAKEKALKAFLEADFGPATKIQGEVATVQDENGNYLWK